MATLLCFQDPPGPRERRRAVIRFDGGGICVVSFRRDGVVIKQVLLGPLGWCLYCERDGMQIAAVARTLTERFPNRMLPAGVTDFNFSAFANGVMHCASCDDVSNLFHQITYRPPGSWPPPPWWNTGRTPLS